MMAMVGATALAYLAMETPDAYRLAGNLIYDILVVGPITYLYLMKG